MFDNSKTKILLSLISVINVSDFEKFIHAKIFQLVRF
jgi:hypothetical protein